MMFWKKVILLLIFNMVFFNTAHAMTGNDFLEECRYLVEEGEEELLAPKNDLEVNSTTKCLSSFGETIEGLKMGVALGYLSSFKEQGRADTEVKNKANELSAEPLKVLNICYPAADGDGNQFSTRQLLQLTRVLYKYISDNPEQAGEITSLLYVRALEKVFPCKR